MLHTTSTHPSAPPAYQPSSVEPSRSAADLILANACRFPNRTALVVAGVHDRQRVSYDRLASLIFEAAAGFARAGVPTGARVLIMAPPSLPFYALALGVLASGRVLVLVDGRMRPRRVVHAMRTASPAVVIGASSLMRWWPVLPPLRAARRFTIDGALPGAPSADALRVSNVPFSVAHVGADAPAVVAFTSGSTGAAKEIVRTHDVLLAQHRALAAAFRTPSDDVNLAGFPMAVLHNLCRGTTTVLPDAELRSAMERDVHLAIDVIDACGVTSLSAAPAYARALSRHAIATRRPIASVQRIVVGGGPVSRALCADLIAAFPRAVASAVYGATEAEPIATVSVREILVSEGDGFLAGRPVPEADVVIDSPAVGAAGELLVRGPHVARPRNDVDGWHHTSDVARLDGRGRLWLLGRVGDAVMHRRRVVYTGSVEAAAMSVPNVVAAGFVAHKGAPEGELALEVSHDRPMHDAAAGDAAVVTGVRRRLARRGLDTVPIRLVPRIPVDARHNSKVARADLAQLLSRAKR